MKTTIPALVLLMVCCIIFFSLALERQAVVNPADYKTRIVSGNEEGNSTEIEFWQKKLIQDPNCTLCKLKLANELSSQFRAEYSIQDLKTSDSLLKSGLNSELGLTSIYHALAANAITQHKFRDAWDYGQKALARGDKKDRTYFILFDAAMELGYFQQAQLLLQKHENKNTFNYLIRASKLEDKHGNLDMAIELMEQASTRVKDNPKLNVWSLSNLADMYGHAGKIKKSYNSYLKVLKLDPNHSHSKKGLAWIAFSKDQNLEAARNILSNLILKNQDPQLKLMLAEIADYEGNVEESKKLKMEYYTEVSNPLYSNMYNKYLILLDAENEQSSSKAVSRAKKEVKLRATPEVYDLLAWSYLKNRQTKEALSVAVEHVDGHSEEPEVLYHLGMIFKENDMPDKAYDYLTRALESKFELGPLVSNEIQEALSNS